MARAPQAVSALIFLSPAVYLRDTRWYFFSTTIGRLCKWLCQITPYRGRRRGRVAYAQLGFTADWDLRRIIRDVYVTTLHSYIYSFLQAYQGEPRLPLSYGVPTCIIHGTHDSYVPLQNAERYRAHVQATLIQLEGANHIIVLNNAEEVIAHITHFLHTLP
jgi:pimeloyl-ACP methyl ester carboxylesterase